MLLATPSSSLLSVIAAVAFIFSLGTAQASEATCAGPTLPESPGAVTLPIIGGKIILNECKHDGDLLSCNFVYVKGTPGSSDVTYDFKAYPWASKLVDNFLVDHRQTRGNFLNRLGKPVEKVNLDKDNWVCFSQIFDAGDEAPDDLNRVTSARIIISSPYDPTPYTIDTAVR